MSSARDRFRKANNFVELGSEANKETIVDDIIKDLNSSDNENDNEKKIKSEEEALPKEPVAEPEPTIPSKKETVKSHSDNKFEHQHVINPAGRPRIYDGGYHNYAARLRNDVFDYIKNVVGENKPYKSINEYLNALVLRDMQNSSN